MLTLEKITDDVLECSKSIDADGTIALKQVQLVINAFGWNWVREKSALYQTRKIPLMRRHSVVKDLDILEDNNLVRLLELSGILITFCEDPHIDEVISHMRDQKHYEDVFFSLAVAQRFSLAGAGVALEPTTERGRGDALVSYGAFRACVECYRQGYARHNASLDHMPERLPKFWPHVVSRAAMLRLVFTRLPQGTWEKRLRKLIYDAAELFSGSGILSLRKNDFCTVTVQPLPKDLPDKITPAYIDKHFPSADAVIFVYKIPRSRLDEHQKGQTFEMKGDERKHLMVLFLPPEVSTKKSSLIGKLRKKLAQTKTSARSMGRLLCVEAWPFGEPPTETAESKTVVHEIGKICQDRPDVVGVLFLKRHWYPDRTFRYHLQLCANPLTRYPFPMSLRKNLARYEKRLLK